MLLTQLIWRCFLFDYFVETTLAISVYIVIEPGNFIVGKIYKGVHHGDEIVSSTLSLVIQSIVTHEDTAAIYFSYFHIRSVLAIGVKIRLT